MGAVVPTPFGIEGIPAGAFARLGLTERVEGVQKPMMFRTWKRKLIFVPPPGDGPDKLKVSWSASGGAITRMPALDAVLFDGRPRKLYLRHMVDAFIYAGQPSVVLTRPVVPGMTPIATLGMTGDRVPINFDGQRTVTLQAPQGDTVMVSYNPVVVGALTNWTSTANFDATQPWSMDWEEV